MRSRTDRRLGAAVTLAALAGGLLLTVAPLAVRAAVPSVATLDATARAAGNRKAIATHIGERLFATPWPAEVSQVSANQVGSHLVIGIRAWGVKFHHPLTRAAFVNEVVGLIVGSFAAAPQAEEVDLWVSVPIRVTKGEVVTGDLAVPTSKVVYSISARRSEPEAALAKRAASDAGVYWDATWARTAFVKRSG